MYYCSLFVIQSRVFLHFAWIFGLGGVNFIFECAGGTNIFVLGCALRTTPAAPHRGYPRPPTLPTSDPDSYL